MTLAVPPARSSALSARRAAARVRCSTSLPVLQPPAAASDRRRRRDRHDRPRRLHACRRTCCCRGGPCSTMSSSAWRSRAYTAPRADRAAELFSSAMASAASSIAFRASSPAACASAPRCCARSSRHRHHFARRAIRRARRADAQLRCRNGCCNSGADFAQDRDVRHARRRRGDLSIRRGTGGERAPGPDRRPHSGAVCRGPRRSMTNGADFIALKERCLGHLGHSRGERAA